MARSKLRNTNSALNRGQMVRLENDRIIPLPPPIGRCCIFDIEDPEAVTVLSCNEITEEECDDLVEALEDIGREVNGTWNQSKNCTDDPCPTAKGRCCYGNSCVDDVSSGGCTGEYGGDGSSCPNCCGPDAEESCCPTGTCCDGTNCFETICNQCGGNFTEGDACPTDAECKKNYETDPTGGDCCPPEPKGACCVGTVGEGGSCSQQTPTACAAAGGEYKGNSTLCPPCGENDDGLDICCPKTEGPGPSPTGACYKDCQDQPTPGGNDNDDCDNQPLPIRECSQATKVQCEDEGGIWGGTNTSCYDPGAIDIWLCQPNCPVNGGACIFPEDCAGGEIKCFQVLEDLKDALCAGIYIPDVPCSDELEAEYEGVICCACDISIIVPCDPSNPTGPQCPICKQVGFPSKVPCQITFDGDCARLCPSIGGGGGGTQPLTGPETETGSAHITMGSNRVKFQSNSVGVQINNYLIDSKAVVFERNVFERQKLFGITQNGITLPFESPALGNEFDQSTIPVVDFFNKNERFSKSELGGTKLGQRGQRLALPIAKFETNLVSDFAENGNYQLEPKDFGEIVGGFSLGFVGEKILTYKFLACDIFPLTPRVDTRGDAARVNQSQFKRDKDFVAKVIQHNGLKFTTDGKDNFDNYIELMDGIHHLNKGDIKPLTQNYVVRNGNNTFSQLHQSFFVFDYSSKGFSGMSGGSLADRSLQSGDTVIDAKLKIRVKSHFGERSIPSSRFHAQATSLVGPLRCEPRTFEFIRVRKEIPYSSTHAMNPSTRQFDTRDKFARWDSPSGTGSGDVDGSLSTKFTISEPMSQGDIIEIDITQLLQDAIDNRSSVLRGVLRPVSNYTTDGSGYSLGNEGYVSEGGFGQGNHWFEFFDEPGNRPKIEAQIQLADNSSDKRILAFRSTVE